MTYIPTFQEPQRDKTGTFRCKECGKIISYKANYCDECSEKQAEQNKMIIKKYWWVIAVLLIVLLVIISKS